MKWILPLLTICIVCTSCVTKPYMVGSVNDMFYKRHRLPGDTGDDRLYDYSWQERLGNTAHIPVLYKQNKIKRIWREQPMQETYVPPVTYSK